MYPCNYVIHIIYPHEYVLFAYVWIYPCIILMCSVLIITQISNYFYIIVNIIKILYVVMHAFLSSQHPRT